MRNRYCHLCDRLCCIFEISPVMKTNELHFWERLKWRKVTDLPWGLYRSLLSACFIFSLYSLFKSHCHRSGWRHYIKIENKCSVLLGAHCYHGYYNTVYSCEFNCMSALSLIQMGQINPSVRLYVVTLDGSSQTTELRPPDSFEKR